MQMALAATSIDHIDCSVARLQPLLCVALAMQITQNAELSQKSQSFLPKCCNCLKKPNKPNILEPWPAPARQLPAEAHGSKILGLLGFLGQLQHFGKKD